MKLIGDWEIDEGLFVSSGDIDYTFRRRILFIYHRVRIIERFIVSDYETNPIICEKPVYLYNITFATILRDRYLIDTGYMSLLMRLRYRILNAIFFWSWEDKYESLNDVDTDKYPFLLTLDIFKHKLRDKKLEEIGI